MAVSPDLEVAADEPQSESQQDGPGDTERIADLERKLAAAEAANATNAEPRLFGLIASARLQFWKDTGKVFAPDPSDPIRRVFVREDPRLRREPTAIRLSHDAADIIGDHLRAIDTDAGYVDDPTKSDKDNADLRSRANAKHEKHVKSTYGGMRVIVDDTLRGPDAFRLTDE